MDCLTFLSREEKVLRKNLSTVYQFTENTGNSEESDWS